jgi:hypothetical protein
MENSDFNTVTSDSTTVIDELNHKRTRLQYRGIILVLAPMICFLLIVVGLFREFGDVLFIIGLTGSMTFAFFGIILFALIGIPRAYIRGIGILQRISPQDTIITLDYAVVKIEDTFAFILANAPYGLYFVSFMSSEPTPVPLIDVPKNFFKWSSVIHVEGLRVLKRTGTFSIPTPEREILSGEGVLLVIPIRGNSYMLHMPEFSHDHLHAVAEHASRLASGETASDSPDWNLSS